MRFLTLFLLGILAATRAGAEPPKTVATISPVYGIVSDVMRGAGTADLILPASEDPHHFSLRPSQLRQIGGAQILFAVGNGMEPWLERVASVVPADALVVLLSEIPEVSPLALPLRNGTGIDPHMWLNPEIVGIWAQDIAENLAEIDPDNAAIYWQNAEIIGQQAREAQEMLATNAMRLANVNLITTHDAFQYLEHALGLETAGALSDIDGVKAGARSLSGLAGIIGPVCLIDDVAHPNENAQTLFPDATLIRIDTLGTAFAGQPGFVEQYFTHLNQALAGC